MSGLLEVLILEDNPDDAELMARALRRNGFELDWQRVETPADFLRALERRPDVILSDYNLPAWTGLDAFEALREAGNDIPFILVTGALGDEAAVECLKRGMADYVLKENLQRLPLAVRRALDSHRAQLERSRIEEALEALARGTARVTGEAFFPALVENLARALGMRWALVGRLRGDERETVETLALWDADHLADNITYDLAGTPCGDVIRQGFCIHTEGVQARFPQDTLLREMGAECYAGSPLRTSDGSAEGILAVLDDRPYRALPGVEEIFQVFAARAAAELERLQKVAALEEAAEEWERTFNTMSDMVTIHDPEFRIVRANRAAARTFDHEPEDMIGKRCYQVFHQLDCPVENCPLQRSLRSGELETLEIWEPTIDKYLLIAANPIRDAEGRQIGVVHVSRDITARKRTEATWRALNTAAVVLQRAGLTETEIYETASEQLAALGLRGVITLFDEEADAFVFEHLSLPTGLLAALEELTGVPAAGFRFARGRVPAYARVVGSGQAVYVADSVAQIVAKLPPELVSRLAGQLAKMIGPASAILAPLRVEGRVMGVLHVGADWLTEADVPAITAFADQLSTALENARLYQAALRAAERRSILHWASQEITRVAEDLEQVYHAVHQAAARLMPCEAFVIALADEPRQAITAVYLVDQGGRWPAQRIPSGHGLSGQVLASGEPLLIQDFSPASSEIDTVQFGDPEHVRSVLAVPMRLGDRIIGAISAQSYRPHAYTTEDQDLLEMLAAHAAVAVENARLFDETQRQARQLAALHEVDVAISTSLDTEQVYTTIVERAVGLLECDVANLFLWDEAAQEFVGLASHSAPGAGVKGQHFAKDTSRVVPELLETRRPVVIPDAAPDPRVLPAWRERFGVRALLALPLLYRERVTGFLFLLDSQGPRHWSQAEVALAESLSAQAAVAIENARLHAETRRHAERLAVINQVGLALGATLDLPTICRTAYHEISRLVDAPNLGVFQYESATQLIHPIYLIGNGEPIDTSGLPPVPLEPDTGPQSRAIVSGQPVIIADLQAERARMKTYKGIPARDRSVVRAMLIVPLIVGEKVVGTLQLQSYRPGVYTEEDAQLLSGMASQIALAIQNARLFDETRRRAEETTALLTTAQAITLLDLDAVLETIASQAKTLFQADGSRIHLIEPDGETLRCAVALHDRAEAVMAVRLKLGQGFTGRVALNGKPELIPNTLADSQHIQVPGTPVEPEAVALTPLKVGGQTVGVMTVTRLGEERPFTQSDFDMLTAFANQAAVAIDNARLYEQIRRRAARLEALNAVIAEAAGVSHLSNLLEVTLDHTLQALGLDIGAIWVAQSPGAPAPHFCVRGLPSELSSQIGQEMAKAASAAGWDIRESQAMEDWQTVDGWLSEMTPTMTRFGIRASLTIPLRSEDRRIGGLSVAAREPRSWTVEEVSLAEAIGRQLGGAVQRLCLLEEARAHAEMMDRLAAAGEALNRPLDFDEVVAAIGQAALELGSPDRAALYLRNPDDTVACPWAHGLSPAYLARVTTRAREMPGGRLFDSTDPVLVPDAMQLPEDSPLRGLAAAEGYQAVGLWPLVYEGQVVAAVGCYHDAPHRWTAAEQEAMGAFTRQAAAALENARLYAETRRRAEELGVLADVSTALREAGTVEEMVPVFVEKAVEAVNGVAGTIFLFESGTGDVVARGRYPPEQEPLDVRHPPGEGITGHVYATGELHFSEDLASDPLVRMQPGEGELLSAIRSAIALPLRTQEQIVGVMHVGLAERRAFTDEEVRLLTAVAEMAGNALHRAALHEQTRRHVQRLTAIRNIDRAISSSLDLKVVLNVLLTQITGQPGVDAADVMLFHPRTQTLKYAAGHGFYTTALQHTRLRLGEGLAGQAALEQRPVSISDLESGQAPEIPNLKSEISNLKSEGFTAYFGVPLISKGQVQGVLEIYQREPKAHDPHWLEFLEAVAAQAAIAIDNATLLDQAKRSNLELTLAYDVTLEGWARALELRDAETEGHTRRVTEMALRLARAMGLNGSTLAHTRRGALLHDIGKLGIPDSVLLKPGELDDEEWDIIRLHPVHAYELLSPISYLRPALDIPYCHHERWDGSGYPRGLKGEQIPLPARIFAVVDVYDALSSDRPYRSAWPEEKVLAHIREQAGKHFDPEVVKVFMKILED